MTAEEFIAELNREHFVTGLWAGVIILVVSLFLFFRLSDRGFAPLFLLLGVPIGLFYTFASLIELAGGFTSFLGIVGTIVGVVSGLFSIAEGIKRLGADKTQARKKKKK